MCMSGVKGQASLAQMHPKATFGPPYYLECLCMSFIFVVSFGDGILYC